MPLDISNIQSQQKANNSKSDNSLWEFLNRDISIGSKSLGDKRKERFYSELSVLINSGIDLASTLDIVVKQEKHKKTQDTYTGILDDLIKGDSFSTCLKKAGVFSNYEYYSIMIGEESGTLPKILEELSDYYKTRLKQRRQITSALTYPILVITVALGAVIFMLNVIVPMFAGVFQRFGGDLPPITQKIMGASEYFSKNFLLLLTIIGVFIGLTIYLKRFEVYRKISTALLLRLPIFGLLTRKIYLSRFCSTLQLLVSSQAPIIEALSLINKMIRFYPLNVALEGIQDGLAHGKSLNESMQPYKIFDIQLVSLVKVGEETGKLEHILQRLYEQYTDDIQYRTAQLGSLLEPLLIIGVGILVMIILIAMYLPLFQLSTSII
ncbi:MAG TPA: type II secretion system F family protein [Bacteroidales bacterium]|jgi:type IV pilus assembly protein PilC|nr:type II secretion system F family protein [Bacteroidales bacterium]